MKNFFSILLITAGLFFLDGCTKHDFFNQGHDHPHNDHVGGRRAIDWYKLQLSILLERNSSLNSVYFGYIGIGLYEAVRYGADHSVSFSEKLYQMPAMPDKENSNNYNWEVSANAAMAAMVRSFYGGLTPANAASIDSLETAYNEKLRPSCGADGFARSQAFGKNIAAAIFTWSASDDFNPSNAGYIPPVFPGSWEPTLPAFANGVQPYISSARPFLSENLTAVAAPFPAAYSEKAGSDFYKIVKKVYDVSKKLTSAQKDMVAYYVDQGNGVGYTPGGHDLSIVTQALEKTNASLAVAAEAYAKAGIAEREATIVCFRAKYKYNLVRPVTYIRKFIDTSWLPLIVTPPHPEYPAAHAFITGSVMQAVSSVLGDHLALTDHTYDFRGWPSRSHTSLFKIGEEAGISRLYGGIHYLTSIDIGLSLGKELGNKVGRIKLYE